MVFITLGSQKFQFDRLLKAVDNMIKDGVITERVFAQTGYSDYKPEYFKYTAFLDQDDFLREMDRADIVITHGGTGAIIGALKKGKKVIAVPRLKKYGEHVDDHQLQIVKQFNTLGIICECDNTEKLGEALKIVRKTEYIRYKSETQSIIRSIENFLNPSKKGTTKKYDT